MSKQRLAKKGHTNRSKICSRTDLAIATILRKDTLMISDLVPIDMSHATQTLLKRLWELIGWDTRKRRKTEHLKHDLSNLLRSTIPIR